MEEIQLTVQAIMIQVGAAAPDALQVREMVDRLAQEVDVARRSTDEVDMNAPPNPNDQHSRVSSLNVAGEHLPYRAGFIEKAKIPNFSGKLEEYPDFKHQFCDLTLNCGHPPSALLQQLRDKVPQEARAELVGAKTLAEAWETLDERYGDMDMTSKMVKDRLHALRLDPQQPQHDNVIALVNAVKHAIKLLDPQQQEATLSADQELVGVLVGKLPQNLRDHWHDYASNPDRGERPNRWNDFKVWLNNQKRKAVYARKETMISGKKAAKIIVPVKGLSMCAKCGLRHSTLSCPSKSTRLPAVVANVEEEPEEEECSATLNLPADIKTARDKIGPCPCCGGRHSYPRKSR